MNGAPMSYMAQLAYLVPMLVLVGGGCALLLVEAFARGGNRRWVMKLATLVSLVALFGVWVVWRRVAMFGDQSLFDGMIVVDKFSLFFTMIFVVTTLFATLLSADFMREYAVLYGEFYPLLLFSAAGMSILASAGDLVTVFLGVETMSMGAYVLTGSFRRAKPSAEAALKYFVTGAFATGFLLYGIALVYGMTGTTNLAEIQKQANAHIEPAFLVGMFMIILAFGFKIAAVPFHMWAPDAYEGAPTPVTGFMAAGIKAAGFAGIMRVFLTAFNDDTLPFGPLGWATIMQVLAVVTMSVGNLAALRQENLKRMLAYSSIAHAGYLLIGVVAAGVDNQLTSAQPSLLFYLFAYTFTTLGAFGIVSWYGARREMIDDWAGLGARHPAAAAAMTVFMLSLGGLPPTGGFFGKFYLFRSAMEARPNGQLLWLVIAAVVNSLVSMYYYLRVVMAMYFREPTREVRPLKSSSMNFALAACAALVLIIGLMPTTWLDLSVASTMMTTGK